MDIKFGILEVKVMCGHYDSSKFEVVAPH